MNSSRLIMLVCLATMHSLSLATVARAADNNCTNGKWSVEHEAALIRLPETSTLASSSPAAPGKAYKLDLVDLTTANLPMPPGRAPKVNPSKAGFARFAALSASSTVQVSTSEAAWIDIVQDGKVLRSSAFSAFHDCSEVHKSVRFSVSAAPFIVEISGTTAASVAFVVTAAQP